MLLISNYELEFGPVSAAWLLNVSYLCLFTQDLSWID